MTLALSRGLNGPEEKRLEQSVTERLEQTF
jgi:hypothetical protein